MFKEFKEFALKGNLADMAVAFVMGAAFTKLSTSFIQDLVMPLVGMVGDMDYSHRFIPLSASVTATTLAEAQKQGPVLAYGNFISVTIDFLMVAFVMFLVVKAINKARRLTEKKTGVPEAAPELSADVKLLTEIRDLLKK